MLPEPLTDKILQSLREYVSLGALPELIEQSLAADEKLVPAALWLVLILISVLTFLAVGCSVRRRLLLAVFVLPLTVAIVLSLVSELDTHGPDSSALNNGAWRDCDWI